MCKPAEKIHLLCKFESKAPQNKNQQYFEEQLIKEAEEVIKK